VCSSDLQQPADSAPAGRQVTWRYASFSAPFGIDEVAE
jgi:hypothetical protein